MYKIIITGASGFVGANLTRNLLKTKHQIHIFTRKNSKLWRLKDIKTKLNTHTVSLNNSKILKKKLLEIKPRFVFHCATYGVLPSQTNFSKLIKTNVIGTYNLLQALEECNGLSKLVNLDSSFVYGQKHNSIKENQIAEPITPYGIMKLSQTNLVRYYSIKRKIPSITMRLFTPFGRFDQPGRLITDIMKSLITKKPLTLFSPYSKRDFIHIDDTINALILASKSPFKNGEIFNVGSGKYYSVKEFVTLASKVSKTKIDVNWKNKQREFDKLGGNGYANIRKISENLGWKPKITIQEGLLKSYKWYKKNIHLYVN